MKPETLQNMLMELGGQKAAEGAITFTESEQLTVLLSAEGAFFTVDGVIQLTPRAGFVRLETGRGETYLIEEERVVGFKRKRADREGTGFRAS